jgi:hypothetical protein
MIHGRFALNRMLLFPLSLNELATVRSNSADKYCKQSVVELCAARLSNANKTLKAEQNQN